LNLGSDPAAKLLLYNLLEIAGSDGSAVYMGDCIADPNACQTGRAPGNQLPDQYFSVGLWYAVNSDAAEF
jgi:hypothetical protein